MDCSRQDLVLGKNNLRKKTVSIVGLGAIGTNAANLLARAGLKLIIIDKDKVEESNINSQGIYANDDIGKFKSAQLLKHLKKINPCIKSLNIEINSSNVSKIKSDLVLDCLDNMKTRFLLNDYCKQNNIPLIHAAAIKTLGTIFIVSKDACLRCIYKNLNILEDCSTAGILNTTASAIASIQANEALKILTSKPYEESLLRMDLANNTMTRIKVSKNCELCSKKPVIPKLIITKCRDKGGYSVKQEQQKSIDLKNIKKHFKVLISTPIVLVIKDKHEIIVHNYGELIFKGTNDMEYIEKNSREIYRHG